MSFELNFDKGAILKREVTIDIKSTAISGPIHLPLNKQPKPKSKQRLKGCHAVLPLVQTLADVKVPKKTQRGEEAMDLDTFGLDGNQDLGTFLNFEVEGDQEYTDGLEVPPWDDFLML